MFFMISFVVVQVQSKVILQGISIIFNCLLIIFNHNFGEKNGVTYRVAMNISNMAARDGRSKGLLPNISDIEFGDVFNRSSSGLLTKTLCRHVVNVGFFQHVSNTCHRHLANQHTYKTSLSPRHGV